MALIRRRLFLPLAAWLIGVAQLHAEPAQVILIRHAEKPPEGNHLSLKGRERAAALVPYFLETPDLLMKYGQPAAIYAQQAPKPDSSLRAIETVEGLAKALKLEVITSFQRDRFAKMVDEINTRSEYAGKTVLICWEHHAIPEIAKAFKANAAPDKWPGESFDRTWVVTFHKTGRPTFQDLPQRLLFGDSER